MELTNGVESTTYVVSTVNSAIPSLGRPAMGNPNKELQDSTAVTCGSSIQPSGSASDVLRSSNLGIFGLLHESQGLRFVSTACINAAEYTVDIDEGKPLAFASKSFESTIVERVYKCPSGPASIYRKFLCVVDVSLVMYTILSEAWPPTGDNAKRIPKSKLVIVSLRRSH